MASVLQQAVEGIQMNDYISLAVITAVGYDYILTFSSEIEYIWNKPWTWVSTLFVLARYCGLCAAVFNSTCVFYTEVLTQPDLKRGEFVPSRTRTCYIINLLSEWSFCIFMCAADLVMILRVWALHNQSRLVLVTLLTFFAVEMMLFIALDILYDIQDISAHGTAQVLQFSFCTATIPSYVPNVVSNSVQIGFGTLMCLLTANKFIKESLQAYRVTKAFQLNRYMRLLVRDGAVYFFVILLYALVITLLDVGLITLYGWQVGLAAVQQILPFTLVPRFVISLRALYARDLRGRQGSEIDSAFGLGSQSVGAVSAIMFADAGQNEGEEAQGDGLEMEGVQEVRRTSNDA